MNAASNGTSSGSGSHNALLYPAPPMNWVQYAEAANAQYNADNDYYEGYDYNRHNYGYGYGNGGELTPNAARSNGHSDEDYFANPYSPNSPNPSANYYAQQTQNGYGVHRHGSIGSNMQRPASYAGGTASATSSFDLSGGSIAFPEPELHRSLSQRAHAPSSLRRLPHQSISDVGPALTLQRTDTRSSYAPSLQSQDSTDALTEELSNLTLESEEGLTRFQKGELPPNNEEWHLLVPETAREALGEKEVQRQSILFEIFKSERDYVRDLEVVFDVIVDPLRSSNAFKDGQAEDYIHNVFWNISDVLSYHQRMLGSLFARQRDQHPLIQSVSDIILETVLQFQPAYEEYIKHYPLAEARHRTEIKRNPAYTKFLQDVAQDPRIRKRDLVTFISRPVTRLPRLSLLLETLLKKTDDEHPDRESLPLITNILGDFVKSTQPGIEAAESKVKFWNVMENLRFRSGEIIDLDEQDESRTLVHSQTLARRLRSEIDWHGWNDFFVVLLDHYLLITREHKRPGSVRYEVVSRPIPLEYLRLGQFDQPSENRKDRSEEGGLLDSLRYQTRQQYPFTIYHAAAKASRRYTLYTNTEAARRKWRDVLTETMAIHQARQDANKWFAPSTIDDGVFRVRSPRIPLSSTELFTGAITAAATFVSGGKNFFIVGTEGGVYVCMRGEPNFRRVLSFQNASFIAALQQHNKIIIHTDALLLSYSMDIMARVSQDNSPPNALDASVEKISGQDNVILAKVGFVRDRTIVAYASKSFRQTTVHTFEAAQQPTISRSRPGKSSSFRPFGNPFYVPRSANEMTMLSKTIAVAGDKGITIVDPTNLSSSAMLVVPDFTNASSDSKVAGLKERCDDSKPLGLARVDRDENMVIYEDFACYIDRHGLPRRDAAIVRWEFKAVRFAERQSHILLFSTDFVEVRHKATGQLVQVIEGSDVRLLNAGFSNPNSNSGAVQSDNASVVSGDDQGTTLDSVPILMARRGKKHDVHGQSIELLELVKTTPIGNTTTPVTALPNNQVWGEWDMR
ncbi:uncharacterized protein FOMMEDRAFT_17102 [Fomitiporia mediterranea MF3/22]|uniref:uncharacterized protein n=1 Tax=Fomitiporia mediterranea (strain MF3/22) TaxID=694068 RepID=UPI0004408BC7|nr:uncharacterized protein FOMMEDRAFT_17102 [Fomitiporia mediterranea MF3/22]EJD06594.1 hypothetical protein FOMMEDRAFT_17102 [Fomitiporia mediterranea MF3/22]